MRNKLKFITFKLTTEDFDQLVKMLEKGSYDYTLGQRRILEDFVDIQKGLKVSV